MKRKLIGLLNKDKNVEFAYLFGSYADGTYTQKSDVDIALFLKDTSLDAKLALHHQLQKALRKEVDLVILNSVKNIYLIESILKSNILLKDHPDRPFFELKKHHEVLDFKIFRKYIDAA